MCEVGMASSKGTKAMASKEKDIKTEMDKFEAVQKGRQSYFGLAATMLVGELYLEIFVPRSAEVPQQ